MSAKTQLKHTPLQIAPDHQVLVHVKVWSRAQADIDRIVAIWRECLSTYGGPYLFGKYPCVADAMYAPVVTRFLTYDVALDPVCTTYCQQIMALPAMQEWVAAAKQEPDDIDELDAEF